MTRFSEHIICVACGTQYARTYGQDFVCPICADDRQYVPEGGQAWTNLPSLQEKYGITTRTVREGLVEIQSVPAFAIGQRALLMLHPSGNILWDCIAPINDAIIEFTRAKGGVKAIAFSHPHYFTTMNVWADAFDCPILIHEADEQWIFNRGPYVQVWKGEELSFSGGVTLHRIGGHFPGSSILQVKRDAQSAFICCGDTFYCSPSRQHLAAMYSYPNRIPLPVAEIKRIRERMQSISFDALYGFYDYQDIHSGAKSLLEESLARYC